jgi:hypothetical protein
MRIMEGYPIARRRGNEVFASWFINHDDFSGASAFSPLSEQACRAEKDSCRLLGR